MNLGKLNMNEKLLSIIIPAYNIEAYIEKAVNSLLIKDIDKLDILIINDGSLDNTLSLAKKYECLYPESIRVVNKENGNYGSCINIGLEIAKGKYVKILDGDDYFDNNSFSEYIKKLSKVSDEVDVVLTKYQIVDSQGNTSRVVNMNAKYNSVIPINKLSCIDQLQHHAITYRLDKLKELGYKQTIGISYTDQEWISIPLFIMQNAYYLDTPPLYCYLIGRDGQSMDPKVIIKQTSNMVKVLKNMVISYEKYKNDYPFNTLSVLEKIQLFASYVYSLFIIKNNKQLNEEVIIEFDSWLKDYSIDVYRKLNQCIYSKKIKFEFIRKWRKHSSSIPFFRFIINTYYNFKGWN